MSASKCGWALCPRVVTLLITSHTSVKEMASIASTCRNWRQILDSAEAVWHRRLSARFGYQMASVLPNWSRLGSSERRFQVCSQTADNWQQARFQRAVIDVREDRRGWRVLLDGHLVCWVAPDWSAVEWM